MWSVSNNNPIISINAYTIMEPVLQKNFFRKPFVVN